MLRSPFCSQSLYCECKRSHGIIERLLLYQATFFWILDYCIYCTSCIGKSLGVDHY